MNRVLPAKRQSKICPCCEKVFYRKPATHTLQWTKQTFCSKKCGSQKVPTKEYLQNKLQYIFSNSIITELGCLEWQGNLLRSGHAIIRIFNKPTLIHRFVWEQKIGDIPEGLCVCHHCDNPKCINPDHLFLGTHQDNMTDMVLKGRHFSYLKLNPEKKSILLEMAKEGIKYKEIANKLDFTRGYIEIIARRNGIRRNLVQSI